MSIQDSMTAAWVFIPRINVHHIIGAYPWPESSLLWLQKTNLEFVWYLPLISVALLSLTLSQTVEGCYVKRDDFPADSTLPTRQSYQKRRGIVRCHIHHCAALTAKSVHLKIRLLLPYSSIELQGKPICHVAFQIWAMGTGKGPTSVQK